MKTTKAWWPLSLLGVASGSAVAVPQDSGEAEQTAEEGGPDLPPCELVAPNPQHGRPDARGHVPPGHWLLVDIGRRISARMPCNWIWPVTLVLVPLVFAGSWAGMDNSGIALFVVLLGFLQWGPEPRLYATMVWLALAMELWGTQLGNWTWAQAVPGTPFTMANPPLLCGVLYAFGDVTVGLVDRFAFCDFRDGQRRSGVATGRPREPESSVSQVFRVGRHAHPSDVSSRIL